MRFVQVAPQIVRSADGLFIVQGRDRQSLEYLEGRKKAIIEVEHGPRYICIFASRVSGWLIGDELVPMTSEERETVVERVAAAERFHGLSVEISIG